MDIIFELINDQVNINEISCESTIILNKTNNKYDRFKADLDMTNVGFYDDQLREYTFPLTGIINNSMVIERIELIPRDLPQDLPRDLPPDHPRVIPKNASISIHGHKHKYAIKNNDSGSVLLYHPMSCIGLDTITDTRVFSSGLDEPFSIIIHDVTSYFANMYYFRMIIRIINDKEVLKRIVDSFSYSSQKIIINEDVSFIINYHTEENDIGRKYLCFLNTEVIAK
jgi:hypothetical protein